MAMKRCSECGEKYSDTYKRCPFCEEEAKLSKGKRVQPKRPKGSGRGAKGAPSDKENALTLVLIVIMLVLAGILLWLLFEIRLLAAAVPPLRSPPAALPAVRLPVRPQAPRPAISLPAVLLPEPPAVCPLWIYPSCLWWRR